MIGGLNSKEDVINALQNGAKYTFLGASATGVCCSIWGRDYRYPCTVAMLSAFAWLSIYITKSGNTKKLTAKEHREAAIDDLGMKARVALKKKTDGLIDGGIALSQTALGAALSTVGLGSLKTSTDPALTSVGSGSKSMTGASISSLVGSATNRSKASFDDEDD